MVNSKKQRKKIINFTSIVYLLIKQGDIEMKKFVFLMFSPWTEVHEIRIRVHTVFMYTFYVQGTTADSLMNYQRTKKR